MSLERYTTQMLEKLKADFEYTAQMAALEQITIAGSEQDQYAAVRAELERREERYRETCTRESLFAAAAELERLVGQRDATEVMDTLGDWVEDSAQSPERRLNPRSSFFREIILQLDEAGETEDAVRSVVFVPGGAVPVDWVKEVFADLSEASEGDDGFLHYEVLRLVNERCGRIEFVAEQAAPGRQEVVRKMIVSCWA